MEKYNVINKGTINLNDKVMVSDPCYGLGTWCQGIIENVLPGEYECKVGISDEGRFGNRVADIMVTHKDYAGRFLGYEEENFEVGVDSGQAGIYDYEYYKKYHAGSKEAEHVDDDWYDRVCDLTYIGEKNPNYEKFEWNATSTDDYLKKMKACEEYMEDWRRSQKIIYHFDANTIDGLGFVSSSGYGDGGYVCWVSKNKEGKVVSIYVEFITEDDDDEEED